ncbi:hypothetical protein HDU83_004546 [Entophlyctis luteolus]|nr:hypothetical protein HDU83_004546 [Entophlyctis luteolus]
MASVRLLRPPRSAASLRLFLSPSCFAGASARYYSSARTLPVVTIYDAPLKTAIQALKRVSVASLVMTWATTPLFAYKVAYAAESGSAAAVGVLCGALVVSSMSTAVIHWTCKPYVATITAAAESAARAGVARELTFTRYSILGQPYTTAVPEEALRPAARLFSTWRTPDGELFFVHVGKTAETAAGGVRGGENEAADEPEVARIHARVLEREKNEFFGSGPGANVAAVAGKDGATVAADWDSVVQNARRRRN